MQQLLLELAPAPAPTLENFVAGRNGAALQALRAALAGEERVVYLWGASGCGKTHLLRGFAAAAGKSMKEYFAADDVERLDDTAQIALFDTCNRLHLANGALVTAGNTPPAHLALREDLRTRLASGIVLQVHALSDEEKTAALAEHAARRGIGLGDDLVRYLLNHFERDMGTQIALLDALDRYSLEHKRPITLPLLKQALGENIETGAAR